MYGTTNKGGAAPNDGTVFKVTLGGTITSLYSFASETNPQAGLVLANDGNFYGVTTNGGDEECNSYGCGTVFRITPKGNETILYSFCSQMNCESGAYPWTATLVQGIDGSLYGTTSGAGSNGGGTVFKITPAGALTILHSFGFTDGASPESSLIQATDGNFYGTTAGGGDPSCQPDGCGTLFRITPDGRFTSLHSFNQTDGDVPTGVIQASDANLYGTTELGGSENYGTVFKATLQGAITTLHSFTLTDGINPFGTLVQATDGSLYGTTQTQGAGIGTIFSVTLSGVFTTLYSFCSETGCADGERPIDGLIQSTNGILYGTASGGGTGGCDCGTVFSLDIGLGAFVAFVQRAGKVGQTGGILGQNFTGTTSVMLNGVPASFTVVSDTFIRATVPQNATTGYVTVTTPTGGLTSNVPFHVIQ